jgi:hypothetical protein
MLRPVLLDRLHVHYVARGFELGDEPDGIDAVLRCRTRKSRRDREIEQGA